MVITGGSRSLGLAIARQLASEGARLALLARDNDELERAKQELSAKTQVFTTSCDVRERNQVQKAIQQVLQEFGRIDILINNAGTIEVGPVENMQVEDFDDALATHLWGPLFTILEVSPIMKRQGGGRIVNIASIGGRIAVPHLVPYSASKFALVGLSDGMRAELSKDHITVTTVSPGLLRTGSPPNAFYKGRHSEEYAWFSISDNLPLVSISAERTAAQIIEACKLGQPELTVTLVARLGVIMNTLFPNLIARLTVLEDRFLPKPTGSEGNKLKTGWESQAAPTPSPLANPATQELNEVK